MRPVCGVYEVLGVLDGARRTEPAGGSLDACRAGVAVIEAQPYSVSRRRAGGGGSRAAKGARRPGLMSSSRSAGGRCDYWRRERIIRSALALALAEKTGRALVSEDSRSEAVSNRRSGCTRHEDVGNTSRCRSQQQHRDQSPTIPLSGAATRFCGAVVLFRRRTSLHCREHLSPQEAIQSTRQRRGLTKRSFTPG